MTLEDVFKLANALVLPAWLVLILFPTKSWRTPAVYTIAALLGVTYVFYVVTGLGDLDLQAFSTLAGVKALFATDVAILTGWLHYLVFDLLVGHYILIQSQKHQIAHGWMIPCLVLCFMFGPAGFMAYLLVRAGYRWRSTKL